LSERPKPGRLTHTASSVFWHEEPQDILTVPSLTTSLTASPPPPPLTRAAAALGSLPPMEHPDPSHLPGILEAASRSKGPRPNDPLWGEVEEDFRTRMESTRPSLRLPMARVLLALVGQWEKTGDEKFLQGIDFNRLPGPRKAGEDLLPSRTALIRSESTSRPAVTNSPRFRPSPSELTAGRMDYEGMCEVLWDSTRAVEFECWRSRRHP
jgi:hypothetical protein